MNSPHPKQFLVIIEGPMGAGKTTIGNFLRKDLKRTAILSTDMIKYFLTDFERGERDNAITAAVLLSMCREYARQGINIVLAQGFWNKEFVVPYKKLAEEYGMKFFGYELEAPKEFLMERVKNRPRSEFAKTPLTDEIILRNLKNWEDNRYHLGKVFDVTKMNSEEIAKVILKDLTS